MDESFELASVLDAISAELRAADKRAQSSGDPIMQFEECELEMSVQIKKEGKAGVMFSILAEEVVRRTLTRLRSS
jgi:Trypsin-co-occurring domain 2